MSWQIFLLISILGEAFGRVLQRNVLKGDNSDPKAFAIVANIAGISLLFVLSLINGFKIPNNLLELVPNLLLMMVFYGGMNILIFKALEKTEASIFTILFGARAIIVVLLAVALLKEPFAVKQVFGLLLILTSVFLVSFKKQTFKLGKGEIYSLLAGLLLAFGVINDSFILKSIDARSYSIYGFLLPTIFMWAVSPGSTKNILTITKRRIFFRLVLSGLIFAIAYFSYNSAYSAGNNAAQIGSIFQSSSVLTVLLAIVLLKEGDNLKKKLLATIISFMGVSLVS